MAGSDKINLDPVAAAGDPMERLVARVAELERQLSNLRVPAASPPTIKSWNASGVNSLGPVTYVAQGGVLVLFGGATILIGQNAVPQYGGSAILTVNGSTVDTATTQSASDDMGHTTPVRPLMYTTGKTTAGTSYSLGMSAAGLAQFAGFSEFRLMAVELPFSG